MAIFQDLINIISGAQVEIAIFIVAIVAHSLLFGKYRFQNVPAKTKKVSSPTKRSPPQRPGSDKDVGSDAARCVKNLVLQGASADAIENEIYRQMPQTRNMGDHADNALEKLAGVVDHLGRNATVEVFTAVRQLLQKNDVCASGRLGELLLRICFSLQLKDHFNELLGEMEHDGHATPGVAVLALRAELATGDLDAVFACLRRFAAQWCFSKETPSASPHSVIQQIVRLVSEQNALAVFLQELTGCNLLTPWLVQVVLSECSRRGDVDSLRKIEKVVRSQGVELTPASCCLLVQTAESDQEVLQIYETHLASTDVCADCNAAQRVAEAAFRCQRPDIIPQMMAATKDASAQVQLLKVFGADRRIKEALAVFKACPNPNVLLYNTALGICIDCEDKRAMERIFAATKSSGLADVVTYNTVVKAYSLAGNFKRAFEEIEAMKSAGLSPNQVTFNELIDATIKHDVQGAWALIEKMNICGLKPNRVTCSILLKAMQQNSRVADIERTFALLDVLNEEVDEVLLSSACEACVRVGRADLLTRQLKRQASSKSVTIASAHTFGSLIRAHGYVQDTKGAWKTWNEMTSRRIIPTSITIGCMVEALVSNGEPDAGYDLIRELLKDDNTRPLVNAVIYCSVLKGFSHERRFERVWDVYQEMRSAKVQFSIVTYNALIDACARSRQLTRAQSLLIEMEKDKIDANTVTYSTIIKGYCNDGRLEQAFELLKEMKMSKNIKPDEVTYNTVLDGCARLGLYDRGVAILNEMQEDGVRPSNFTLSLLAKLANRSKLPDKAFELCEELSKKYNIRLNVHVYNNLVQACTQANDCKRALGVFVQMCKEQVRPDGRTYTLLLRSCMSRSQVQDAHALLWAAFGLRGAPLSVSGLNASVAQLRGGLPSELISEVLEGIAQTDKELAVILVKDLKSVPGVRIDPRFSMGLAARAIKSSN